VTAALLAASAGTPPSVHSPTAATVINSALRHRRPPADTDPPFTHVFRLIDYLPFKPTI
jgi:hypothetical protein